MDNFNNISIAKLKMRKGGNLYCDIFFWDIQVYHGKKVGEVAQHITSPVQRVCKWRWNYSAQLQKDEKVIKV